MKRSRMTITFAFGIFGCSSTGVTSPAEDAAFDATTDGSLRIPKEHRPAVVACDATRPPGSAAGTTGGACTKDSDCTTGGKNGRCYGGLTPNACSFDECATDSECGSAVCLCRVAARVGAPNVCFRGNCRTDADCAGNFCSPSGADIYWNCTTGVPIGSYGFFCHGPTDECIDHDDCGAASNVSCVYDVDAKHFKCLSLVCTK